MCWIHTCFGTFLGNGQSIAIWRKRECSRLRPPQSTSRDRKLSSHEGVICLLSVWRSSGWRHRRWKKSIHNTTLRIQHKHVNLRPTPRVCCDPEVTIFCYCSLISIERIRPTQNWLYLHKLEIEPLIFSSLFSKNRSDLVLADSSSFSQDTQKHSR